MHNSDIVMRVFSPYDSHCGEPWLRTEPHYDNYAKIRLSNLLYYPSIIKIIDELNNRMLVTDIPVFTKQMDVVNVKAQRINIIEKSDKITLMLNITHSSDIHIDDNILTMDECVACISFSGIPIETSKFNKRIKWGDIDWRHIRMIKKGKV